MTISDRLRELNSYLYIHPESDWSGSPNAKEYTAFNDGGVECEVGEFLYAFIRILKPEWVLETGTHLGIGASYISLGLTDNGKGTVETIEYLQHFRNKALENFDKLKTTNIVSILGDVKDFSPTHNYQLILLDTEPSTRFQELIKFYPYLDDGGYFFIHDLPNSLCQGNINADHPEMKSWPFGDLPEQIKEWVRTDRLRIFHLPSPRGLVGFYKTHATDYHWS